MPLDDRNPQMRPWAPLDTAMLLDELGELATHGGERDATRLARFQRTVAALRTQAKATGPFRAKVASASGWAALLFSSWRHLKYDRPNISGADRVRAFIMQDVDDARRIQRLANSATPQDWDRDLDVED